MIVVRSCKQDMTSHNGFQWPETGFIEAPDWNDTPQCGHGLHALRPGDNNPGEWHAGKYLAVETHDSPIIDLGGKVKFRRGEVLHVADNMHDLSLWLTGHGSPGPWYYGSATAGDRGTATVGEYGTATAGDGGSATAGNSGTATVGYGGLATAGNSGTATAGKYGTATAGKYGTATAGDGGSATAGDRGTATVGEYGIIQITWWDGARKRITIGYVGEMGIEPNVKYRLNDKHEFEKADG